ncbi:lysylphosphatidylglycerol synthase transmembrane domain-containing protein [Chloroflexota bacterium]
MGFIIIVIIIYWGGAKSIQITLKPKWGFFIFCFLANLFLFVTSSIRWGYVINQMEGQKVCSYYDYFNAFISGRFFGQYVSRTSGDLLFRPGVLNRMSSVSLKKGVYATFVEKVFDLIFIFALIIPAILYLFDLATTYTFLLISATLLAFLFYFLVRKNAKFVAVLKQTIFQGYHILKKIPLLSRLAKDKYLTNINNLDKLRLLEKKTLTYLFGMTCLRYFFVFSRLFFLVAALGLSIPLNVLLAGVPVAQLSLILAFTPGALGVLEGGWYTVFRLAGVSEVDSVAFLIGQRVYWLIFISIIFLINYLIFGVKRLISLDFVSTSAQDTDNK